MPAVDYTFQDPWDSRLSLVFNVLYAALLASLILAALIAVFGCFNIGLAYGLGQICNGVVGAVDDLCFELNVFGIDSLKCGAPFRDFCDEFALKNSVFTYWGSFIAGFRALLLDCISWGSSAAV
jgi:hypothetical protein